MNEQFDADEARKFLQAKEEGEKQQKEIERKTLLEKVTKILQQEFKGTAVEVYLIGTIIQPFRFSARSDIDIVLKNYQKDRFEFWAQLERQLERRVEIIPFETCRFKDFVLKEGLRVN